MVLSNCSYWEAKKGGLEVRPGPYSPPAHLLTLSSHSYNFSLFMHVNRVDCALSYDRFSAKHWRHGRHQHTDSRE